MFRHLIYVCPKCQNTLLLSNKMLHDLRCTESNPATYEKILSEQKNKKKENTPQKKSLRFSNGLRKSNVDGTSSDIKKNIKSNGKEEYIETKYDSEGNIISRKKTEYIEEANNENNLEKNNYKEVNEFYEEEDNNNQNINIINDINNNINVGQINYYVEPTVNINNKQIIYTTTGPAKEIIYEAPARYDPNIIINKPIEETVISSNEHISDSIMNDILIRNTLRKNDNIDMDIILNNDTSEYNNYEQTNYYNNVNNINKYNIINNSLEREKIHLNIDNNYNI